MTDATLHDDTICLLGEGPLWHPERGELLWFDILGRTLHRKGQHWRFDSFVSAAGWVDRDRLLIATDSALVLFDLGTGTSERLCGLEADNPVTRCNDGRADPQGGFWIGTMGIEAEPEAGGIYRYYKGELRALYPRISIPNSICFAPDGRTAYWADTPRRQIMAQRLAEGDGWPVGDPVVHVDLTGTDLNPDGSVVDAAGTLWNAQWGAGRIAGYDTAGAEVATIPLPAAQITCPAFGGPDMETLFATSAACGQPQAHLAAHPETGRTFAVQAGARGQAEHRVIL